MPVRLRLQRHGRKQAPFYHIVAADSRSPRDGKFLEKVGTYNPLTSPATIEIDRQLALKWLLNGAEPTPTVRRILGFKGVLYLKHLSRGVKKGALTQEQADKLFAEWLEKKEATIASRRDKKQQEAADMQKRIFGTRKEKPVVTAPAVEEETTTSTEETSTDAAE